MEEIDAASHNNEETNVHIVEHHDPDMSEHQGENIEDHLDEQETDEIRVDDNVFVNPDNSKVVTLLFGGLDYDQNLNISAQEISRAFDWLDLNTDGLISESEMFSASVDTFIEFCSNSRNEDESVYRSLSTYYWAQIG